jgi:hypothetical protein
MNELLLDLGYAIEFIRDKQKDSGSVDEWNEFESIIKTLNNTYDKLVYIGD